MSYPSSVPGWVLVVVVAVAVWLLAIAVLIVARRRTDAREVALLIPNLLRLFRGLLGDPRVPRGAKVWIWFAVVWLVSPIDLVPEFVPVRGRSTTPSSPPWCCGASCARRNPAC